MNKYIADISGDIYFTKKDFEEINRYIGGDGILGFSERGNGETCEIFINFAVSVLSGISAELLILIIKAIYKKSREKLKSSKREEVNPKIIINSYNYDHCEMNFNFSIDFDNPDIKLDETADMIINAANFINKNLK